MFRIGDYISQQQTKKLTNKKTETHFWGVNISRGREIEGLIWLLGGAWIRGAYFFSLVLDPDGWMGWTGQIP